MLWEIYSAICDGITYKIGMGITIVDIISGQDHSSLLLIYFPLEGVSILLWLKLSSMTWDQGARKFTFTNMMCSLLRC